MVITPPGWPKPREETVVCWIKCWAVEVTRLIGETHKHTPWQKWSLYKLIRIGDVYGFRGPVWGSGWFLTAWTPTERTIRQKECWHRVGYRSSAELHHWTGHQEAIRRQKWIDPPTISLAVFLDLLYFGLILLKKNVKIKTSLLYCHMQSDYNTRGIGGYFHEKIKNILPNEMKRKAKLC